MTHTEDEFNKKRLRSSNITVVISISLVLFLVGLFGLILINAQKYSDYIKEQLVVNAFFTENYNSKDSIKIAKAEKISTEVIKNLPFVKKVKYISRKDAVEEARKSLGIDIHQEGLFDTDIFPSSVEITLKPEYTDSLKIKDVLHQISKVDGIVDVKNDTKFANSVFDHLDKILLWISVFSVVFLVLAIVLINNSIRLKVFSKRFIIKTMQLVGARRFFILKPFIKEAILLGFLGAILGLLFAFGVWYYFTMKIKWQFIQDENQYLMLIALVFLLGIFITVVSTIFATWKFLRSHVDDLYYS